MTLPPNLMIPTGETRERIQALHRSGMPYQTIARRAGLHYNSVYRLLRPEVTEVSARIAQAIAAVQPEASREHLCEQAAQRVRALCAIGWPYGQLATRCGLNLETVMNLALGRRKTVSYRTARAIEAAYEELWDAPYTGTGATAVRNHAARHGWPKPMELDL